MDIYAEWVDRFLKDGHAYHCYCSQEELAERRQAARKAGGPSGYDGHCRDLTAGQVAAYQAEGRQPVVRFKMPPGSTTFTDLVRGEVTFDHAHVPDFTLTRADGTPLYTLAVAVDDVLMKITHVVRGEDLLSSTPRQIAVYRAMGVEEAQFPVFAHLPYVLGKDGQRLSKRNGVVSVNWYREQGFLPEAICNYLALLGWSPGENREEFTMAEMAAEFDLARVNKNAAQFDVRKLEAINGDKIRALDPADFAARITPFLAGDGLVATPPTAAESELIAAAAPLVQERVATLARRGAGAGGRGGGAGRARALDRGNHQGGAGDRSGGGTGPQAAGGVRRGGAGRDHRTAREPAAVRVDRAAGPRPYAGPPGPGAGYRRWWR
jgi:glutamyl-tRNA synthetase